MAKKVAVLAVNPVNGFGLFQYLEPFFENGISYKVFAVSDSTQIKTNSGITLIADDVVANLRGKEGEYDAVVFACGDAIPKLSENVGKQYYQDMFAAIDAFARAGKILAGHCAAAGMFDNVESIKGRRVAVHPYGKAGIKNAVATDVLFEIDGNFYTAQQENEIWRMMPELLKALK